MGSKIPEADSREMKAVVRSIVPKSNIKCPFNIPGQVVALGYEATPKELSESSTRFICLQAEVKTEESSVPVEFVVDTLSESATLTEEYFNMCKKTFIENRTIKCPNNLEYTGSIYAGKIQLGNRCFEIEVSNKA